MEIKALKAQINNLQKEAIQMEGVGQKESVVQKLLDDKDKEIQALKKRLKSPAPSLLKQMNFLTSKRKKRL